MDPIQARGFAWFELLIAASYLGAATNLAERVITRGRAPTKTAPAWPSSWKPRPRLWSRWPLLRRPPAITMRCSRGHSSPVRDRAGHRTRRHAGRRRPRRHGVHPVTRDRLPARRHPRPGLPPALTHRRRLPHRPVPRRRPANPLMRLPAAVRNYARSATIMSITLLRAQVGSQPPAPACGPWASRSACASALKRRWAVGRGSAGVEEPPVGQEFAAAVHVTRKRNPQGAQLAAATTGRSEPDSALISAATAGWRRILSR